MAARQLRLGALRHWVALAAQQTLQRLDTDPASRFITTDPDNTPSQKVITANSGLLLEHFNTGQAHGHTAGLRFRIVLTEPFHF